MKQWHGLEPMIDNAPFPYEPKVIDSGFLAGEPVIKRRVDLSLDWLKQVNNGVFRDWSDIAFVRHAWKKPLLLKGIQSVQVGPRTLARRDTPPNTRPGRTAGTRRRGRRNSRQQPW